MGTSAYSVGTDAVLASHDYFKHPSWACPAHPPTLMFPIHPPTPYPLDGPSTSLHPSKSRTTETSTRVAVMGLIFCLSLLGMHWSTASLSPHLNLIPHSCLIPRHLEEISLSHPIHCLLCRKALWHGSAYPVISPLLSSY